MYSSRFSCQHPGLCCRDQVASGHGIFAVLDLPGWDIPHPHGGVVLRLRPSCLCLRICARGAWTFWNRQNSLWDKNSKHPHNQSYPSSLQGCHDNCRSFLALGQVQPPPLYHALDARATHMQLSRFRICVAERLVLGGREAGCPWPGLVRHGL